MADTMYTNEWYEKYYTCQNWSKKHPDKEAVLSHFRSFLNTRSIEYKNNTPSDLNVSYGVSYRQKIDYFYGNESKNKSNHKPVFVYIHGGYWQLGNKEMYSVITHPFTKHNYNAAVIGFDLAPECSIPQISTQVSEAISAINSHFAQSKLIIYGHSAGAYLAAVVARSHANIIQNIVLISGVYNLCPLLQTTINDALQLTKEQAENLSSIVNDYDVNVPAHIYVADDESPEFKKQSQEFYLRLSQSKIPCILKVIANEDHFSIIERLTDENFTICQDMLLLAK